MIFYLTYNDAPSGIFSSQVIDVVKFLNSNLNVNVKLVSLVSARNYFSSRRKIKNEYPLAIVLPMFPGVHRWEYNRFLLSFLLVIYKPRKIIGRSVIATQLALKIKGNRKNIDIIYDGRGAIEAEWKEYGVVSHPKLLSQIHILEKAAILESQKKLAVSNKLINFWESEFGIKVSDYVVIPCTLNKVFEELVITEEAIRKSKKILGINENDILLVYSGSVAGWQSFKLLYDFVKPLLLQNPDLKLLFLSDLENDILKLQSEFKEQVICKKVKSSEVPNYLLAADYGLLIREESKTNFVASPVKFAEYLSCGLQVIISNNLGDYSDFVLDNHCGYIYSNIQSLPVISFQQKFKNRELALKKFTKSSYESEYQHLVN